MRRSVENGLGTIPTASGGITRLAYQKCLEANIECNALLQAAGITRLQATDSNLRIQVQKQIKFLNLAALAVGDEFLGFHLGQSLELQEIGLLYYVMASSCLLGDALERGSRYSLISNEGVHISFAGKRNLSLRFDYKGVRRYQDRHQIEFFITVSLRLCRQITGRDLRPTRVALKHIRRTGVSEVKRFFGCEVVFGSDADVIEFEKSAIKIPLCAADPYLNKLLLQYCDYVRRARKFGTGELRINIENAISPLLPHKKVHIRNVADSLGISERTLSRRLAREGLRFSGIVQKLRYDLARQYIEEANVPMSKIAWLLGYSDVSSFTHAFKRWSGGTPTEYHSSNILA